MTSPFRSVLELKILFYSIFLKFKNFYFSKHERKNAKIQWSLSVVDCFSLKSGSSNDNTSKKGIKSYHNLRLFLVQLLQAIDRWSHTKETSSCFKQSYINHSRLARIFTPVRREIHVLHSLCIPVIRHYLLSTNVFFEKENPFQDGSCLDETNEEPLPSTSQLSQAKNNETSKEKSDKKKQKRKEANLKTHLCKYCKKTFNLKSKLIRHRRIHTGVKPY